MDNNKTKTRQQIVNQFDNCREQIDAYLAKMDRLSWEIIRYNGDINSEEAEIGWNMLRVTEELSKINDTDITKKY